MNVPKGSAEAWVVRRLLEAWIAQDPGALKAATREADSIRDAVVHVLVVVTGGGVNSLAVLSGEPYEDALTKVWSDLGADPRDSAARQEMRTLVAGWTTGDDATADALNTMDLVNDVDFDELVMEFVALAVMLASQLTQAIGEPFRYATDGWWEALGTTG
jgi:hypothetical protein